MIFCFDPPVMTVRMPGRIAATTGACPASTPKIAFGAGNVDLIDSPREGELFRRHEIEVEGGHGPFRSFLSSPAG